MSFIPKYSSSILMASRYKGSALAQSFLTLQSSACNRNNILTNFWGTKQQHKRRGMRVHIYTCTQCFKDLMRGYSSRIMTLSMKYATKIYQQEKRENIEPLNSTKIAYKSTQLHLISINKTNATSNSTVTYQLHQVLAK